MNNDDKDIYFAYVLVTPIMTSVVKIGMKLRLYANPRMQGTRAPLRSHADMPTQFFHNDSCK